MELLEKQKELQRSSYELLKERIELLTSSSVGKNVKEYAKAKGLVKYVQQIIEAIEKFQKEYFQQVVSKLIKENEDYLKKELNSDYKNSEDFLAEPITECLLKKGSLHKAVGILCNKKVKFKEQDRGDLEKRFEKVMEFIKDRVAITGDTYGSLSKDKKEMFFKEMPQRVALAINVIAPEEIAYMLTQELLTLQVLDNADVENTSNTRQSFGGKLGEKFHERIAWRFFSSNYDKDKILKLHNLYFSESFDEIEMLSKPLWHKQIEFEVGQKMIDFALDSGILGEYSKPHDEKNFNYLKLTKDFLKEMSGDDKSIAYSASMTYKPMVIEPLDWCEMYGGGFLQDNLEDSRFNLPLIKASSSKDRKALVGKEIPQEVLDAVNHLQKSAFKIHKPMLEVLLDYHSDINYLSKKNRVDFAYYRILREILSLELDVKDKKEIVKHFKKSKFIKLTKEKELNSSDKKRINSAIKAIEKEQNIDHFKLVSSIYYEIAKYKQGFDTITNIAKEMLAFDKFYFVWRMDFRGRLYPQQTLLNPQAGDLAKSLLLFSEEKALTKEGLEWFLIHGANCYGEADKKPFKERIEWVESHRDAILASVKDYRQEDFWKKAGDPFKFLAWAFEYARYCENPEEFKTSIPIAIDGSNNGFQHITALMRDEKGAEMVNVLPHYEHGEMVVADFYKSVANRLKELMQSEADKFEEKKDELEEKSGLYYEQKKEEVEVEDYQFDKVVAYLETIEPSRLKYSEFFVTVILKASNFDALKDRLQEIERRVRVEVGEDDLEEVKASMIDELERLHKRVKREISKGNVSLKKEKAYREVLKQTLYASSLYGRFLEHNHISRKFVKSPVMTESYGSSTAGKAKALLETIEGLGVLKELDEDERYLVALTITKLLEKALNSVSKSPKKYKDWMKSYAKEMVKKRAIKWTTPLGLEVEQVEYKFEKLKVAIGGYRKVEFNIYTDEIAPQEHVKGLSPNYIHSLDASHLMMTINALAQKGISDIVTVHDSFATHSNEVTLMSERLREMFIELHKNPILETFAEEVKKEFKVEGKKIPYVQKERFDLDEVAKSIYFFA